MFLRTFLVIVLNLAYFANCEEQTFRPPQFDGIRNALTMKAFIHKYTQEANKEAPVRLDSIMAELGPLTGSEESLVNSTAKSLLYTELAAAPYRYEVSKTCLNHTEIYLEALLSGKSWALQMIDSIGKPPSNILGPNIYWVGSYEECLSIKANKWISDTEQTGPFNGMYCSAYLNVLQQQSIFGQQVPLIYGFCLPDSCSDYDATVLTNLTFSLLPINMSASPVLGAACKRELEYSSKAIAVIVVCSIFLAIMTVATVYDMVIVRGMLSCLLSNDEEPDLPGSKYGSFNGSTVTDHTPLLGSPNGGPAQNGNVAHDKPKPDVNKGYQKNEYTPGLGGKILLSFSVYSNSLKILSTNQPAGTLTAVNGVRFISMTWVILGHTYAFGLNYTDNLGSYLPDALSRFSFQCISNATVAVDTFFVLSGLLVSYLSLKEMHKRGGAKNFKWGMYYFHRFWRLTPPYMFFLMFYVPLFKYWSDGPFWPSQGVEIDECKDTWWQNILYINNFFPQNKMCMGWSWYLANDMQFYVISPLFLIPLYYSPLWGSVTCLAFILLNFITTGVISSKDHLSTSLLFGG